MSLGLRRLYQAILSLYPARFRDRFKAEMMSIFDEQRQSIWGIGLIGDALLSVVWQWLFRTPFWPVSAAVCGALMQACWFGRLLLKPSTSNRIAEEAPATDALNGLIAALICAVLAIIVATSVWQFHIQRSRLQSRSRRKVNHPSGQTKSARTVVA